MKEILEKKKKTETALNNLRKGRILVIDDSTENIMILGSILKNEGYDVLTANTSVAGISIAIAKTPDIILLDIMMPDMNGYDTCAKLKRNPRTSDIPVIFLTALTDHLSIVKGFEAGAVDYVNKPFNKHELLARLKNHFQTKISNEHTKALFESMYHTYITINKDLLIVNYNNIANVREELFGNSKFVIGQNIFNYITDKDHTIFKRKIENVFLGKVSVLERQYKLEDKDCWFNYIFEPIVSGQGEIVGCLINGTDITDKKGFELRVQEYNSKLKEVYIESQQSLEFASLIQNAIFPSREQITSEFDSNFLLYKPKDIVSGDFYWMHTIGNKVLMVLGDCTGHGVPGALLTTISVLLLQRIVKFNGIMSPDEILYEIDANMRETLKNNNSQIDHGMEIAVCLFDKKRKVAEFCGAKRSLYMTCEGNIHEYKAVRTDIGGNFDKVFKKQLIPFTNESTFYLFSDGITDQIGGPNQKRFMKKNLLNLIALNCNHSLKDQKKIFEHAFSTWTRGMPQTDDMTMIGLKLS
jgi:PAS domain S-box-containing protein